MSLVEFSASLNDRLDKIVARSEELQHLLSTDIGGDEFAEISREYAELSPIVELVNALRKAEEDEQAAQEMAQDPEMRELAEAELQSLHERIPELKQQIRLAMLPRDKADERSAILELRPAAGGDEAALFAAELFSAYQRYSEARGWRFEILGYNDTELGGLKEGIASITGVGVFMNPVFIVFNGFQLPKVKDGFILQLLPWPFFQKLKKSMLSLMKAIYELMFIVLRVLVGSMLTKPKVQ